MLSLFEALGITFLLLVLLPSQAQRLPNLVGHCQVGEVHQSGKKVFIVGDRWSATGQINSNNVLFLRWNCKDRAESWDGLYKLSEEGHWIGHFGLTEKVQVTAEDICGEITSETLYWRKP